MITPIFLVCWGLMLAVLLAHAQPSRSAAPDEAQIKRDVWGDAKGKINAERIVGKGGEFVWKVGICRDKPNAPWCNPAWMYRKSSPAAWTDQRGMATQERVVMRNVGLDRLRA